MISIKKIWKIQPIKVLNFKEKRYYHILPTNTIGMFLIVQSCSHCLSSWNGSQAETFVPLSKKWVVFMIVSQRDHQLIKLIAPTILSVKCKINEDNDMGNTTPWHPFGSGDFHIYRPNRLVLQDMCTTHLHIDHVGTFVYLALSRVNRWYIPAGRMIMSPSFIQIRIHLSSLSRTSKYPLPSKQ